MRRSTTPRLRVTARDFSTRRGPELIDEEFDDYSEADAFYETLRNSEDDYRNVCLWRNDGWWLAEGEEH